MQVVEALAQVVQRCVGCLIPGEFQGKSGSGPRQSDVAVVSLCLQGTWTVRPLKVPSNSKDSVISCLESYSRIKI